jgi:hypothetical protein
VKADDWRDFPQDGLKAVKAFLRARGLPEDFNEVRGRGERYWSSTVTKGKDNYELFIYADAAGFWKNREHWQIFERPDFRKPRDQIEAFVDALESAMNE